MSDFYEHAIAELRDELKEESYIKAELKEQLATKSAHNNGLLEKINDLGNEVNTLRQTVHELRQGLHSTRCKLYSMRNCDNCNKQGCHNESHEERGEDCEDNDFKLWEFMP